MAAVDEIRAFDPSRRSNAELIRDCYLLGYINPPILDPTYGMGNFYTLYRPIDALFSDLNRAKSPCGTSIDFRSMPHASASFRTVIFDPRYKLNGTPQHELDDSYGADEGYLPWREIHQRIRDGLDECTRVLAPRGHLLLKCQDQVSSGRVRWQTLEFIEYMAHPARGCSLVDMLFLQNQVDQPAGRRQVHARRNYSTLLVFKKTNYKTIQTRKEPT